MLGAEPARLGQPGLQRLTRAMDAHAGVARREPALGRVCLQGGAADLDLLQRVGVFGLQRAGDARHAGADLAIELGVSGALAFELARERVEPPAARLVAPVMIDDGVAQRGVEPGHDAVFRYFRRFGEIADERVLQDVFGERTVADAPLQEREEPPVIVEQCGMQNPNLQFPTYNLQ